MKRLWAWINHGNDMLVTKLALLFGFSWTIWIFFIVPLIAPYFSREVQAKVFYYGSGWVQLFALPLMVYVGNKLQRSADKQDKAQAETLAEVRDVVTSNADLARIIRTLTEQNEQLLRRRPPDG